MRNRKYFYCDICKKSGKWCKKFLRVRTVFKSLQLTKLRFQTFAIIFYLFLITFLYLKQAFACCNIINILRNIYIIRIVQEQVNDRGHSRHRGCHWQSIIYKLELRRDIDGSDLGLGWSAELVPASIHAEDLEEWRVGRRLFSGISGSSMIALL